MSASPARRVAREVVTRVRERSAYAHELMDSALRSAALSPADAALATRLAYGTLQAEGTLLEVLDRYLGGKRVEPRISDALRVSAYEILFMRSETRAAVHQGVELVREVRKQAAGLANAVLRRLAEDAPGFPWGDPATDVNALARLHAHPVWLAEMWIEELGRESAELVMAADNTPAPLYLAANRFAGTAETAREVLRSDGARPRPGVLPGSIEVGEAGAAVRGQALQRGLVLAVDACAQLVVGFVGARPGERIVEVGAGRGTKTVLLQAAAVAAGGPAELYAVDSHEFKARLLAERLIRYGVPGVRVLVGDATHFSAIEGAPDPGSIDAVLVDAPCSGLGTLRRHPEKRWRVGQADIDALAVLGSRLLGEAARLVRRGGFVVYSTCTVAERENADVVRAFLGSEAGSAFRVDSVAGQVPDVWRSFVTDEGFFRSLPLIDGPDGHFAARLVRV
jgi:16S rRNA (cytosine967-C5)-methyltransferase